MSAPPDPGWTLAPVQRHADLGVRTGSLHMVCALSEHRGQGLGRLVSLAALHYLRDHGFPCAILHTDDWRLAAIRSYLGLGFVPAYVDDPAASHVVRWSVAFATLFGPRPAGQQLG
jgi:ribosomal protein S18 acetylase RimI-like enzyme